MSSKNEVEHLFIYPVKSLLGVEVPSITLTANGLQYDRSFVLATASDGAATAKFEPLLIKTNHALCLFQPNIDFNSASPVLTITHKLTPVGSQYRSMSIPLQPSKDYLLSTQSVSHTLEITGTLASGHSIPEAAGFFSYHLSRAVELLYTGIPSSEEPLKSQGRSCPAPNLIPHLPTARTLLTSLWTSTSSTIHPQSTLLYQDAAPLSLTTSASVAEVKSRLPDTMASDDTLLRFRSNIHVQVPVTTEAFTEDRWAKLTVRSNDQNERSDVDLHLNFTSVRCMSLNADFETGKTLEGERQVYKTLMKDRRKINGDGVFPNKPCFGRYAWGAPVGGTIRVGDEVIVEELGEPMKSW